VLEEGKRTDEKKQPDGQRISERLFSAFAGRNRPGGVHVVPESGNFSLSSGGKQLGGNKPWGPDSRMRGIVMLESKKQTGHSPHWFGSDQAASERVGKGGGKLPVD